VEGGEEVRITRHGKTVAVMATPDAAETQETSIFGQWRERIGKIKANRAEMETWIKEGRM